MGAHPLGIVERRALKHDLDAIAAILRDQARERLVDMPARKGTRKTGLDALAAVVILEGWMEAHPEKISRAGG